MVPGLNSATYADKLKELNLQSLEDRRVRFDMIQVFKIMNCHDRVKPESWFRTQENINVLRFTKNLPYSKIFLPTE